MHVSEWEQTANLSYSTPLHSTPRRRCVGVLTTDRQTDEAVYLNICDINALALRQAGIRHSFGDDDIAYCSLYIYIYWADSYATNEPQASKSLIRITISYNISELIRLQTHHHFDKLGNEFCTQ